MSSPLVCIACTVYNHEKFIAKAIDGFLMQNTNFRVVIVIGDDCSTDNTRNIINEYYSRCPDKFALIYQEENVGPTDNFLSILEKCYVLEAKYIAICEGDDYWTDPLKLQKQVDFMDANADFALCCHRYKIYNTITEKFSDDYCAELFKDKPEERIIFDRFFNINHWLTKTLTVLFRADCLSMNNFRSFSMATDSIMFYLVLMKGKGCCLPFVGGVYQIQESGVCSGLDSYNRTILSVKIKKELYKFDKKYTLNRFFPYYYSFLKFHFKDRRKIFFEDFFDLKLYLLSFPIFLFHCLKRLFKIIFNKR